MLNRYVFVLGATCLFILICSQFPDWVWWQKFAPVFNDIGLGLGAILAGIGAIGIIDDYRSKKNNEKSNQKWINKFPVERLNKDFDIIQSDNAKGILYIHDKKLNKKHWIADPISLRAMGLDFSNTKTISYEEFKSIESAGNIQIKY